MIKIITILGLMIMVKSKKRLQGGNKNFLYDINEDIEEYNNINLYILKT